MGRRNELKYETWTPDIQGGSPDGAPLRVHSWFDHKRNVMVIEVAADRPQNHAGAAAAAAPAREKDSNAA